MGGIFTISLDFELHWGLLDIIDRKSRIACYQNTLQAIPEMLKLFVQYDVHVTWAVVGSMFAKDQKEWEGLKPAVQPDYVNEKLSPYKWVEENGLPNEYEFAHFAPKTIKTILNYSGQETGTHTFSHYYCLAPLKGQEAFSEDLNAAKQAAAKFNIQLRSFVFPRNQFNPKYLKTCYDAGIRAVRTNSPVWYWKKSAGLPERIIKKITRTANDYVTIGERISYSLKTIKITEAEPLQLPRGRALEPWMPKKSINNKLRLRKVIKELHDAAIHDECYHLWWHPESFGDYPEENLNRLRIILEQYKACKERYGMKSWNMGEYADNLIGEDIKATELSESVA
ncbi:MAG: polysaccharide deacetylase family protein [Ginsengibacter sp.]